VHSFFKYFRLIWHATLYLFKYDDVLVFIALFLMRMHMVSSEL